MRLNAGADAPRFEVEDTHGNPLNLESLRGERLLLSFHRFAACPLCNLHVDELVQHHAILEAQGLRIIAFFQSKPETIQRYITRHNPPFHTVADPDKTIYMRYGIESSRMRALSGYGPWNPKALRAMGKGYMPQSGQNIDGDVNLLPGDFLITPDLKIHTAYYGRSAADHMPIRMIANFLKEDSQPSAS